jgi:hypothetical protein
MVVIRIKVVCKKEVPKYFMIDEILDAEIDAEYVWVYHKITKQGFRFTFKDEFKKYFITTQDIRKQKLNKIINS